MRLYLFPASTRALGVVALKNHLAIDCELRPIDLGRGDQRSPEYVALNPNRKMPTLDIGVLVPTAVRLALPLERFPEIRRWYESLLALPAWRDALAARDAAANAWLAAQQKETPR